jgi:hypothetical protein
MPRNNLGEIARSWMFESSSGSGVYETLQYTTGALSCACPGWTRRVDRNGQRSCKHTRMVEQGVADMHAVSSKVYAPVSGQRQKPEVQARPVAPKQRRVEPSPAIPPPSRFKPKRPEIETDAVDLVDVDRFRRL